MKYLTAILSALAMQLFAGCFQSAVALHIKPDGSGTIDKVFSMTTAAIQQAKQQQSAGGGGSQALPTEMNETKLKADAAKLGEGVKFVSAKKLTVQGREGYVATYAFDDVTKLKVALMSEMGDEGGDTTVKNDGEPYTFAFTKGNPSELVINSPVEKKEPEAGKAEKEPMPEAMMTMMAPMFKDMRVSLVVDVQGTIVKTNAVNREGQRVTLADVDCGKVFADPVKYKAMMKIQDFTSPEARALLKTVPGVKLEMENPVRISFK